jgi:hypothetical protein
MKFGLSLRLDIIKKLNEKFAEATIDDFNYEAFEKMKYLKDPCNVLAVYSKSNKAKDILKNFAFNDSISDKEINFSDFNYNSLGAKYSIDYLNFIFEFFKLIDDNPKLTIPNDAPIKVEGVDFGFLLAPRIEVEEKNK